MNNSISLFLNEKQAKSISLKNQTIKTSGIEDAEKKKISYKTENYPGYQTSEKTFKKDGENITITSENIDGENGIKTHGKYKFTYLGNETIINNKKNLIFAEDKASLYLQKKKNSN